MANKLFRRTVMLFIIMIIAFLIINTQSYAASSNARYVMDAELLSNNNIAVLFIKGGTSSNNVVVQDEFQRYGMLYYGIYNPDDNSWTERLIGGRAKEAALAIHDDKAHVAYVTDNDLVGYIYQTDSGWSDVSFISSNDANGEDRANTLSGVDIAIDSNGFAHIVYVDSDGAGDDYYARDDGLYATNKTGSFVKTVVADCTGWFSSPEGDRREMYKPIKITIDSEDKTIIALKKMYWNKWMGGSDTSYNFEFLSDNNSSCTTNGGSGIVELCSDGTDFYTLISDSGSYKILKGSEKITGTEKSFTITAADMTMDNFNRLYYTAMSGNTILLYQNGAFVENVQATTGISSHTRFATVVIGNAQYAIYTGSDEDTSLVISRIRYGQTSEFLVPNEIKTWSELQSALNNGGKVKLTQDLVADSGSNYLSIKENLEVTLDLNGYVLDRNLDALNYTGAVIRVNENSKLVIIDSRPNATHSPEITYRDLETNEDVVVNGGILTGGYSNGTAGGIYIGPSSTVTLNAGTIVGNKAKTNSQSGSAGGVCAHMSTFIMNGGAIVGNEAISGDDTGLTAGGLYLNDPRGNNTSFTMNGGIIAGNYSSNTNNNCVAGIYNSGAIFNISGNSKITGNMINGQNNNVVFSNEYNATVINVTGALTNGASIGISPWRSINDNPLTITNGYRTHNNNQEPTRYFSLDTNGAALTLDSNKEVNVAKVYTVTLLENENGTLNADKLEGISGTKINISYAINDPTVYRFARYEVVSGGVTISNHGFIIGTSDVIIRLVLEEIPSYTLYFDANGGTGTMDPAQQREGTTYTLPECTFTAPEGKEFYSWLVKPIDGTGGRYIAPGSTMNVTNNYTIQARWQSINYTITYDLDGGTVASPNPETYTIDTYHITLVNPTKSPLVFDGWIGTGLTEPTMEVIIRKGSTGNRSYTATYKKLNAVLSSAPTAKENLEYTGNNQDLINAGTSEEGTVVYSLDNENFSETIPQGKNAGNYTVYYKVIGDSYHNDSSVQNVVATITKADSTFTVPVVKENLVYTGENQDLVVAGTTLDGTIKYSLDGENFSETISQGKDAVSYTVFYKVFGDSNHNDSSIGSVVVAIAKADSTFTAPVAKELVYTGNNQDLILVGSSNDGTVVYSLDNENFSETIPQGKDAGNYTVYYKVIGDSNHNDSSAGNVVVTIAKADPTYTAPTAKENLVYTGNNQDLILAGSSNDGTIKYSLDGENFSETLPQGKNAGNYTVYYKIFGDSNHNDSSVLSIVAEIEKSSAYKYVYYPQGKDLTYDGTLQNLTSMGDVDGGVFKYSLDGENFSETVPQGRDAGNYIVYYKIFGDSNHNDSERFEKMCVIKKANPTYTAPVAKDDLVYTGENQDLIDAGSSEVGTVVYSLDGENYNETVSQGKDAGNYTVHYKVIGDNNHNDSEAGSVVVTIAKVDSTYTAPVAKENLVYTGENQDLLVAGSTLDGTMKYSLDGENYSETISQGKDVGTYTVYYKVFGDNNHNDSEIGNVVVSIAKTNPEYVAPVANGLAYNGELQDLITAGSTNDGTIKYSLDGENFVETIPQEKEVGTYIVYYKVFGDNNHNDSSIGSVVVTIGYPDGLNKVDGVWYYYKNNQVQTDFTGLVKRNDTWYYVQDGRINWGVTTLVKKDGTWFYVNNSMVDWTFTGLVKKDDTWYYIQKGILIWGETTLVKKDGTWFYVKNSMVDWTYTGLVKKDGTWYYIQNGKLIWGVTTLVKKDGAWFYVNNSMVDWTFTGLVKKDGAWFYIQEGVLHWGVETLVKKDGTWFYVNNSMVDWSYTGLVEKDGTLYYVQKGILYWGYNGTVTYKGKIYTVKNSMAV